MPPFRHRWEKVINFLTPELNVFGGNTPWLFWDFDWCHWMLLETFECLHIWLFCFFPHLITYISHLNSPIGSSTFNLSISRYRLSTFKFPPCLSIPKRWRSWCMESDPIIPPDHKTTENCFSLLLYPYVFFRMYSYLFLSVKGTTWR